MFGICGAGEFKFGTSIDHGKSLLLNLPQRGVASYVTFIIFGLRPIDGMGIATQCTLQFRTQTEEGECQYKTGT